MQATETPAGTLAGRSAAYLQQGIALLRRLDDRLYAEASPASSRGRVGAHFRHILDHYESFFRGLRDGRVDYDRRDREAELELDRGAAAARIERSIERLRELATVDGARGLEVAMDCGEDQGAERCWSRSTVARELQFLVSHTVHHYAMIAAALAARGVEAGRDFGVAPSTLRWELGAAAGERDPLCAR